MQERTHQAKMVTFIMDQIGPGQNRCLAFSVFTFKRGQNTKSGQINHFQYILQTFTMILKSMSYIQFILVMVYTHSTKAMFFYLFLWTIWVQISMTSDVFGVIVPERFNYSYSTIFKHLFNYDTFIFHIFSWILFKVAAAD